MSGDQSKLQTGVKAMQAGHLTQMTYQGERIRFCFYLQSNSCQLKPIILNYLILIRGLGCVTLWCKTRQTTVEPQDRYSQFLQVLESIHHNSIQQKLFFVPRLFQKTRRKIIYEQFSLSRNDFSTNSHIFKPYSHPIARWFISVIIE